MEIKREDQFTQEQVEEFLGHLVPTEFMLYSLHNISRTTLRTYVRQYNIPHIKVCRRVWYILENEEALRGYEIWKKDNGIRVEFVYDGKVLEQRHALRNLRIGI